MTHFVLISTDFEFWILNFEFWILNFWILNFEIGFPKPEITWSKDGGPIERHLGSAKQQKWSLELEEATTYDSGNYTCTVSNDHGTATFTFKLMIQGTSTIINQFKFIQFNSSSSSFKLSGPTAGQSQVSLAWRHYMQISTFEMNYNQSIQ